MSVDEDMLYESLHESWDEIEELKAENVRLREQNRYLMKGDLLHWLTDAESYEQHKREQEMQASIADLQAENEKLRELVRDSASLLDATCDTYYEDDYHAIIDRIRELGVEVDG